MITSLFSPEAQAVFDDTAKLAGMPGGPFPSPADWRDQLIYFIIVDRFNNPVQPPRHQPFDDPNYYDYQGGNFAGIQQRLAYIKNLGAGAIWLSPVLKNLAWSGGTYHGYGIHDFIHADPRFASDGADPDDELRTLVDAAHQAGLYVIFDIVLNHTGDVFAYDGAPDGAAQADHAFSPNALPVQWRDAQGVAVAADTDIALIPAPSADAIVWPAELQNNGYFRRQGMPGPDDDTTGDFDSLKQLCTDLSPVQTALIRAYQYVIARYDCDGFRIDTLRFLKNNLAQVFGNACREYALSIGKKNFFTYGEVWTSDSEPAIAEFIGRNTQFSDGVDGLVGVDAALDYPLFFTLVPTLKGSAPPMAVQAMYQERKTIEQYILSSHGDASRFFVTFLDNHDQHPRFHYVDPVTPHLYDDQLTMAVACLYCLPGIPCLYYGTEQGLRGGATDPAVREALWGLAPGFPQNGLFFTAFQAIAAVRQSQAALRYGRFYFRPLSGDQLHFAVSTINSGVLAWSRILNDAEVLVAANTHTTLTVPVDVLIDSNLSQPGQAMQVLYSNKQNFTTPSAVRTLQQASVLQADGTTGTGPVNVTGVNLLPMEVQVLRVKY
ncbi:MAG: alpha-amylase family glycosyl hydrolase [Puia sp.]|nr:alpha-amylase family glycosyl hydrolase [Puia sp.]